MTILRTLKYAIAMGLLWAVAFNTQAGLIDFRSTDWAGANGQNNFTVNGVKASAAPVYANLNQNTTDGLGINNWHGLDEPDEIDQFEQLTINLGTATLIQEVIISNFFADENCSLFCGTVDESGYYKVDNATSWTKFTATQANSGLFTLALNQSVQELKFKSPFHEFSVQSIKTVDVPEPGTLALLGLGLVGLGVSRRRK